jgi:hypothetical protein
MTQQLEQDWWSEYRKALEQRFAQDEVLITASGLVRL